MKKQEPRITHFGNLKSKILNLKFSSLVTRKKLLILLAALILAGAFFLWPLPNALVNPVSHEPLRILDRSGKLLYEVREPDFGTLEKIPLAEIPAQFTTALLVSEDRNFYSHSGISLRGIARAAYRNFVAGKVVEGGSTLTQQLVRNRLQPATRNFGYKLAEMYYALRLEWRMSKNEILESYANTTYFGHQAYGIASASKTYFDKTASTLSLAESALLAGLVQAPTTLDPFLNLAKAQTRQKLILDTLREEEKISAEEYATARAEKITLAPDRVKIRAPHFVMWLLSNNFTTSEDALDDTSKNNTKVRSVRTTLNLDLQTETEAIVTRELAKLREKNVTNAAVVVIDARSGELLTLVGSADYFDDGIQGKVNVATSSRQPGSALKPFVYALALARGDTPATTVADVAAQFATAEGNPYTPRNYDYADHGLVRYREALANSYNIAAVKVLERVGVARALNFLANAGITTLTRDAEYYGLALALGAGEVRLLELTQAYGIFANNGKTLPLQVLLDSGNNNSKIRNPQSAILNPKVVWLIANILADNNARLPQFGDDSPLNFDFPVAAKTGTTRNSRDNWTFGFTPERIVGVWVGNANNTPMRGTSGVTGAGPIFHAVMEAAMRGQPRTWFPRPSGIVEKEICAIGGKLPTLFCPHTIQEFFIAGTEPKKNDDIFQAVKIDTRNNLRAGENCAAQFVTEKVFANFPLELKSWARENGYAEAPTRYSPLCPESENKELRIKNKAPDATEESKIFIISPNVNDSFQLDPLIPSAEQKIIFTASADAEIEAAEWFVDSARVGIGSAPDFRFDWEPSVGTHTLTARADNWESELRFEVVSK